MKTTDLKRNRNGDAWEPLPALASPVQDLGAIRRKCRKLVLRRAALSAGLAAVPLPGIDVAGDIALLMNLIEEINAEFGLTPQQIEQLQPEERIVAYQTMVAMGGSLVGKLVTRELVMELLQRSGFKLLMRNSARIAPLAGQVASAAIGFAAFRAIGNQHVEACAEVAEELRLALRRDKPRH
ncbi:protein of unknown function [Noviherbaspirillum humi]|uniref:DUF697 domain-containing protein n=1 Tax=Noviherbaspirillum humi TaxID=1688639 RepID=A0A239JAC9_9BURK|nr:hypothetical protein [Noviherbaspirillum humi]SNT02749.1 protein of unknown function [Noviherbaspirillum humi]